MPNMSLRTRLNFGLALLILITGAIAGAFAYQWGSSEADEMQDAVLLQIGALARNSQMRGPLEKQEGVDAEARVYLFELNQPSSDASGPVPSKNFSSLPDGLHTVGKGKNAWRVLIGTRDDGSRFALSQTARYRIEIARISALNATVPLLLLIPCLLLLVGFAVNVSLRPLRILASDLDKSRSSEPGNLSLKDVPAELYPFVESINRLHGRVRRTLEQQNRFVADAAHELRSPVQALNIQVENLNQTNLPAESANRLLILRSGIKRIARLLEQLLTMAKYDAPKDKFPIFSLDSVAKGVVADVIEAAQDRSIDLGFSRFEESPVRGDEISLAIIIRNLLENAIRHTPDLGRIDLAVYSEGEFSFFVVQDSGAGIPFDEIERVFSPFYRGNAPSGEGAGLGLSIVRRVVSALGGHVTLQNAAGGGLRAVIKLPKAIKSSEPKI